MESRISCFNGGKVHKESDVNEHHGRYRHMPFIAYEDRIVHLKAQNKWDYHLPHLKWCTEFRDYAKKRYRPYNETLIGTIRFHVIRNA